MADLYACTVFSTCGRIGLKRLWMVLNKRSTIPLALETSEGQRSLYDRHMFAKDLSSKVLLTEVPSDWITYGDPYFRKLFSRKFAKISLVIGLVVTLKNAYLEYPSIEAMI